MPPLTSEDDPEAADAAADDGEVVPPPAAQPAEDAQAEQPAAQPAEDAQAEQPAAQPAEDAQAEQPAAQPAEDAQPETPALGADAADRRFGLGAALTVMALTLAVALGGRLLQWLSPRPAQQQCEQLLDHYIEHKSRQRYPEIGDEAISRAQRAGPSATRQADLDNCLHRLSASQVGCGLRAPNIDEMERCLQ